MAQPIYEKKNTPPQTWEVLENLAKNKKERAPTWAAKTISKNEYKHALIIDGELYRPLCRIKHPQYQFNYIVDFETAQQIEKDWNTFKRTAADRLEVEIVVYTLHNNHAKRI